MLADVGAPCLNSGVRPHSHAMTEDDYISELWSRWPREHGDDITLETIVLV